MTRPGGRGGIRDNEVVRPADELPDELFIDPVDPSGVAGRADVTLSLTHAPMVRVGLLSNKYRQLTSRYYLTQFGVGAMDWRMLVVLTKSPGLSAGRISTMVGIDKAAVSRSLNGLRDLGLAVGSGRSSSDRRIRLWCLTTEGNELHGRMLTASLRINRIILGGLGEDDVATLIRLSDRMIENLALLEDENAI